MASEHSEADTERDCPYCPGTLTPVYDTGVVHHCDGTDCPATFVAVIGGDNDN